MKKYFTPATDITFVSGTMELMGNSKVKHKSPDNPGYEGPEYVEND